MKSNSIFFNTLMLAAPVVFWLQGSALAQPTGATNTAPPPAPNAGAAASTNQDNVEFFFPGGTPGDFLNAVEKQYKVDWKKVADIPDNMRNVRIPALRMSRQSADSMLAAARRDAAAGGGGLGLAALDQALTRPSDFSNRLAKTIAGSVLAASTGASNNASVANTLSPPTEAEQEAYSQVRQHLADLQALGVRLQSMLTTNHPKVKANLLDIEVAEARKKALEDAHPALLAAAAAAEERKSLEALVALYNSLGRAKPELGNLLVEGDLAKPSVVIFHSSAPATQVEHKVKAFALKGIPVTDWENLASEISTQFDREVMRQAELAQRSSSSMLAGMGHVDLHKDTSLLVVDGPAWAVEAAESFVAAWKSNHAPVPGPPMLPQRP